MHVSFRKFRIDSLVACFALSATLAACTRGKAVAEESGAVANSAVASRMTDLSVPPATRRLYAANDWVNENVQVSPDGRYVSMNRSPGDLAVRDLTTDSVISLTHKMKWDTPRDFSAGHSQISPDGRSIVYGWFTAESSRIDMKVMSLAGADSGRTRSIAKTATFTGVMSWTPDGMNVVTDVKTGTGVWDIVVCPLNGRKQRVLKTVKQVTDNFSVSPDGRWVAYNLAPDDKNGDRDVFMLALDGSGESVISTEKGDDFVVGWTRDGARLLYGSEQGGTTGLWAASITHGKPTGLPVLIRSDMWRMLPLGVTKAGRIMYGVSTGIRDVFTSSLDPLSDHPASPPVRMSPASISNPIAFTWSPDGEQLAQVEQRSRRPDWGGPSDIVIRSLKRSDMRRISPALRWMTDVHWSPTGKTLVVRGGGFTKKNGIFEIDLATSKVRPIVESSLAGFGYGLSLASDGKTAWFFSLDSTLKNRFITRLDLATGATQVIHTVEAPQYTIGLAISPDGRQLVLGLAGGVSGKGSIALLPVTGGIPREIYRFRPDELASEVGVQWSANGKELIFGIAHAPDSLKSRVELHALSISDGTVRPLGLPSVRMTDVRVSRDGRHLAYGIDDRSSELWLMDEPDFRPARAALAKSTANRR